MHGCHAGQCSRGQLFWCSGDLVLISAGPSYYASVNMVASEARRAGQLAVPAALTALHLMHCQVM